MLIVFLRMIAFPLLILFLVTAFFTLCRFVVSLFKPKSKVRKEGNVIYTEAREVKRPANGDVQNLDENPK